MAEVLSTNEIDALLHALSSGEVDVQDIKEVESSKKVKKIMILKIHRKLQRISSGL